MPNLILVCLLFCASLVGQVVRLVNHSAAPFAGWHRVHVDTKPVHSAGHIDGVRFVVGRQSGLDTWPVDVDVILPPGKPIVLDFARAQPKNWTTAPLPADPLSHFGGPVMVAGNAAALVGIEPDGAGYVAHLVARCGRMPCTHMWVLWFPDQPAIAYGEAITVASNPTVPDLVETVPVDVTLTFGDALVWTHGAGLGGRLLAAGDTLADGQGRALPLLFVWLRHLRRGSEWASVGAAADLGVGSVGIERLIQEGAPLMPVGFSGRAWAATHWPKVVRELHTRGPTLLGPRPRSNDSGEQEVQTFHPGGEAMVEDGVGAEVVRYLSAIRSHALRPCNHLELDGSPIDPARHPQLVFWDGRAHWHRGVSPDQLGKVAQLSEALAGGHWGPDVQHHYCGDLAAVDRLRWSPLADWLLERQATVYLLQRTAQPGWSTTAFESARELACEADLVLHVWRGVRDRGLAERVVARWRQRITTVFVPAIADRDLVKTWDRDPRVNANGLGAQWWQESFASAAIWRTASRVGPSSALEPCLKIARRVLATAWQQDASGRWRAQPQGPIDGSANDANPAGYGFNGYAMPLCVWLVLQVEPNNSKARSIWSQLMAEPGEKARRWMLPLRGGN